MPTTQIKDISTGKLERREQDLLPLSPLVRLLWSSIIDELTTTYDDRPLKLKRMNWMEHPLLESRQRPRPPKVQPLPPVEAIDFEEPDFSTSNDAIQFDDPDTLVDPDMRRVSPRLSRKYAAGGKIWEKRGI